MESKTQAQKVTKVIVFGFVSLIVLSLALLSISIMSEELRQAARETTFRHWLAQWIYFATAALAFFGTAKWVERNFKVGIDKQLGIVLVYGFIAFVWFILAGLRIATSVQRR